MSYILDALKKSEQERHQSQKGNFSAADPLIYVNKNKAPKWPYFIAVALILNAGLFAYFLLKDDRATDVIIENQVISMPKENHQTDTGIQKQSVVEKINQSALSQPEFVAREKNTPKWQTPSYGEEGQTYPNQTHQSTGAQDASTTYQVETEEGLLIRPRKPSQTSPRDNLQFVDVGKVVVAKPTTVPSNSESLEEDGYERIDPSYNNQLPNNTVDVSSNQIEDETYPYLTELSMGFQRSVPAMKFNSHIYSDKPSARRVMINNLYLREGDGISGMVVKTIREEDIILDKNGTVFRLGVLRDWEQK